MDSHRSNKPTTLLRELVASEVRFILVGGLAAVAQGAPITTFDVDIVPDRGAENVHRLQSFLAAHDARYRGRADVLRPEFDALAGLGHNLLMTNLGPLDVLGAIEYGDDYGALKPNCVVVPLGQHTVEVLSLRSIVERKRASPHIKDKRMLPILESVLAKTAGGSK